MRFFSEWHEKLRERKKLRKKSRAIVSLSIELYVLTRFAMSWSALLNSVSGITIGGALPADLQSILRWFLLLSDRTNKRERGDFSRTRLRRRNKGETKFYSILVKLLLFYLHAT